LKPFAPNLLHARIGRILRLRAKIHQRRAHSDVRRARIEGQQSKLQHLRDRREYAHERTIVEWPTTPCPYCERAGVSSFDFSSMRRAWYACLECKKVWLAKRQE
jgi:hypothetical protein